MKFFACLEICYKEEEQVGCCSNSRARVSVLSSHLFQIGMDNFNGCVAGAVQMIRLITLSLGGSTAYLTFMGNEFGHPGVCT